MRTSVNYSDPIPNIIPFNESEEYVVWDNPEDYAMTDHSTYTMYIFPSLKGNYDMKIYVCEELDNECGSIEDEPEKYKPLLRWKEVCDEPPEPPEES